MHQYLGKLIIHTGSMFSGKTSSLERDIKRFRIANYKCTVFKPIVDTRFVNNKVKTHDNTELDAISVKNIGEILDFIKDHPMDVVGIDEVQFLQNTACEVKEGIMTMLCDKVTVVVAGLDMDFSAEPFEIVKELMPVCDYLNKHHAVCTKCGQDAWVSHRKTESKERFVLGALNEYEPLCRSCYNKTIEEEKI